MSRSTWRNRSSSIFSRKISCVFSSTGRAASLTICISGRVTPQTLIELWIIHPSFAPVHSWVSLCIFFVQVYTTVIISQLFFFFFFDSLQQSICVSIFDKTELFNEVSRRRAFPLSLLKSSEHQQVQLQLTRGGKKKKCSPLLFNNTSPREISYRNANVKQCN